jgi:hypothetical protein
LDLSSNLFSSIPNGLLPVVASATSLKLNDNNINTLKPFTDPLNRAPELTNLELQGNMITNIADSTFTSLSSSLKSLDLQDNHIITLSRQVIELLDHLERLSLAGNPWLCDCDMAWVRHLPEIVVIDTALCANNVKRNLVCFGASHCPSYVASPRCAALPEPTATADLPTSTEAHTTTGTNPTSTLPTSTTNSPFRVLSAKEHQESCQQLRKTYETFCSPLDLDDFGAGDNGLGGL